MGEREPLVKCPVAERNQGHSCWGKKKKKKTPKKNRVLGNYDGLQTSKSLAPCPHGKPGGKRTFDVMDRCSWGIVNKRLGCKAVYRLEPAPSFLVKMYISG